MLLMRFGRVKVGAPRANIIAETSLYLYIYIYICIHIFISICISMYTVFYTLYYLDLYPHLETSGRVRVNPRYYIYGTI